MKLMHLLSFTAAAILIASCGNRSKSPIERIIAVNNIQSIDERDIAIAKLPKDDPVFRKALLAAIWDKDAGVRNVAAVALMQSKEKFEGIEFIKYWSEYEKRDNFTAIYLASRLSDEKSEHSRTVFVSYLKVKNPDRRIVTQYLNNDSAFVAELIRKKELPQFAIEIVKDYVRKNFSKDLSDALSNAGIEYEPTSLPRVPGR